MPNEAHDDEHRNQKQLVGHRIEIGAEPGLLVETASNEAIDAIRDTGNDEAGKGPVPACLQHGQHHGRHQDKAQDGDQVGDGQGGVPSSPVGDR